MRKNNKWTQGPVAEKGANRTRCRFFTNVEDFRVHVRREILAGTEEPPVAPE